MSTQRKIPLWTYHKPCFSLVKGRVDHTRSSYWEMEGIPEAYAEVSARLGTDQWICCFTVDAERSERPETLVNQHEVEWVLDIPSDLELVWFYDVGVWARILGDNPLEWCQRKWNQEALGICPNSS